MGTEGFPWQWKRRTWGLADWWCSSRQELACLLACLLVFNKIPCIYQTIIRFCSKTFPSFFLARILCAAPVSQGICVTCCLTVVWKSGHSLHFVSIHPSKPGLYDFCTLSACPSWHQKVFPGAGGSMKQSWAVSGHAWTPLTPQKG